MRPLFGQFRCAYSGKIRKSDGTGGHHFANLARELCPLRTSTRRIHSDFMNIEGPFDIHKAKACSLWKPLQGHFVSPQTMRNIAHSKVVCNVPHCFHPVEQRSAVASLLCIFFFFSEQSAFLCYNYLITNTIGTWNI